MNQQDLLHAVCDEELMGGVWMRPPSSDVWSLVIWLAADGRHVAMTEERASVEDGSELVTDDESEALDNHLERLRALSALIRDGLL
ncbi:hypothetical protein [Curtobacterium sp. PhB136]|uniref:hypothetical protein n=1 Tax=Curtobacterium sp. PhB136 TaxID=2485181 RepID=UPI0010518D35|nr:hypothetical protein [Curtobacterium sp. PhB136]TCK63126.1 hypothetical protein EDF27_2792 [Curtobacterium sp. PhB136]